MASPGGSRRGEGNRLSRRRMLGALGASGALVAGCSSDGGDGDDGSPSNGEGSPGGPTVSPTGGTPGPPTERTENPGAPKEDTFVLNAFKHPPGDWNMAPYNTSPPGVNHPPVYVTRTPFGMDQFHPDREYKPLLMEETELLEDNSVYRVKLAEGFTWHNGKEVTMRDRFNRVKYQLLLDTKLDRNPRWESVELVGDRTMKHTLIRPTHPQLFAKRASIQWPRWLYKPYLEEIQDTTSQRETYLVHQDFKDEVIRPKDWVGTGMFEITDVGENRVIYERYEDYPEEHAKYQNIKRLKLPIKSGQAAKRLLLEKGMIDWASFVPPGITRDLLHEDLRLDVKEVPRQLCFRANHTKVHTGRRAVRRALAYAHDGNAAAQAEIDDRPIQHVDGMDPIIGRQWVPNYEEYVSTYIDYMPTAQPDKAAAELKGANYERNSEGTWVGPDGNEIVLQIANPGWYTDNINTVGSFWNQIGIKTEVTEPGSFWKAYGSFDNEWDLIPGFSSRGPNHPATAYRNSDNWGVKIWKEDENGNPVPVGNRKLEYEIPTELGAEDLSGNTKTINIPDLQNKITDPSATADDLIAPTKMMMHWYNFYVPNVPDIGAAVTQVVDHANFNWVDWNRDGMADATNRYFLSYGLHSGHIFGKEA